VIDLDMIANPRTSLWERVGEEPLDLTGMMTSPTQYFRYLHNLLFVEARFEVTTARPLSTEANRCMAARLCLFKTRGYKTAVIGYTSWREACGWQKSPGIRIRRVIRTSNLLIPSIYFTHYVTEL
jgi:hypothetical protein